MNRRSASLCVVGTFLFATLPAVVLGQHGGAGGHSGTHSNSSISGHAISTSHTGNYTAANSSSRGSTSDHPSMIVVSGRSNQTETGPKTSEAGAGFRSSPAAVNDEWLGNDSRNESAPRAVTIGFPRSNESKSEALTSSSGTAFVGEGSRISRGQVQRGAMPVAPHPSAPPRPIVTTAPVVRPQAVSRPISTVRPLTRIENRRPLWFLAEPRFVDSSEWRRRFRGGFGPGFFGFGFPFWFGFGPDCNPFWAEPFAFGCNSFGYLDGFGGYGLGYQPPENPGEVTQEQEPEESTFIPPPEVSSPEEIQAEKILFVLYMKDGALYAVTNYWIADNKLHYLTSYGGENTIDMSDLDLQKTVDVNAKRGLDFTLKPRPDQNSPNQPQQ